MKKFKSKIKHPPNTYIELTSYSQTLANVKLMTYRWVLADHSSMTIILRTNQLREHKPTVMMNTRMFSRKITGLSLLVEKTSGLSRGTMPRQRDSSGRILTRRLRGNRKRITRSKSLMSLMSSFSSVEMMVDSVDQLETILKVLTIRLRWR